MDKPLLEYVRELADRLAPERIYFFHAQRDLELPGKVREKLPELQGPMDDRLREGMRTSVSLSFPDADRYGASYLVAEGRPERSFLHWADVKGADLIIMGRKKKAVGGVLPKRVARRAKASVLFVPPRAGFNLKRVMIPVDFSASSAPALHLADKLRDELPRTEEEALSLTCFHACRLPSRVYYDGLAGSDLVDLMKDASVERMEELLEDAGVKDCEVEVDPTARFGPTHSIARRAVESEYDLVLISGSGKSGFVGTLIGSTTEGMLQELDSIPVWVVKPSRNFSSTGKERSRQAQSA
jgi:nucleotide-binding universal stress UspA family protein